ncbi:hemolysin [Bifidobacterium aemilianum]|uniref:Hemolysin n=1 Tax=Bifidobacterium aemilianum TaxID=2493120 RepID=A0A366KA14_9BIFI|nr:YggT family protein [Bifidobacterium aemilianum]RBP98580.1 hemolysin [Bifidobacterium aemilianum]
MILLLIHHILRWLISAYLTVLFIRMIIDWVLVLIPRWRPQGVIAALMSVIYQLTEPPLRWLRRYIPPIPMGPISLDVGFLVLYFALLVLQLLV